MKTSWNLFVGLIVTSAAVFGGCVSFQGRPDFRPVSRTGEAVQAAIDAASAAGGGRVILEKGVYPSGTIYLKSPNRTVAELVKKRESNRTGKTKSNTTKPDRGQPAAVRDRRASDFSLFDGCVVRSGEREGGRVA